MLGIPNYGYSWPLPYERGVTKARLIGNVEANVIAAERGVEIQYDERYQSPFFHYEIGGRRYEVWFEDVRSIYAKLQLAAEKDIRGVGYWNLMRPFRANWLLVNQMLQLKKGWTFLEQSIYNVIIYAKMQMRKRGKR